MVGEAPPFSYLSLQPLVGLIFQLEAFVTPSVPPLSEHTPSSAGIHLLTFPDQAFMRPVVLEMETVDENGDSNAEDYVVHPKDLGFEVSEEEIVFMQKFEAQWSEFLAENPHLRPRGRRAARMAVLEKQIEDTKMAEQKAGQELARQLEFFEESREALEETYASEVEYANKLQRVIHDRLEKNLDDVAMSEHLMKQVLPWEFFLDAADMKAIPYVGSSIGQNEDGVRPSARALALIAPDGDDEDVRLRAMRMDHALLTTQIALLEKESERIALTNSSLEFVGKFLTEHNIWGILTKQGQQQQAKQMESTRVAAAKVAKSPPPVPAPAPAEAQAPADAQASTEPPVSAPAPVSAPVPVAEQAQLSHSPLPAPLGTPPAPQVSVAQVSSAARLPPVLRTPPRRLQIDP